MRKLALLTIVAALVGTLSAQAQPPEPPKPGPEIKQLAKHAGTWDITMKAGGMEFKGTTIYKMELGGLWLASTMECDFGGGAKFTGRGMDTYDAKKKKYVGYWFDSMATAAMSMEGNYDTRTKTLTMTGKGPDMTGKVTTWRSVTEMPNSNSMVMSMYVGDAKEPMFTIHYKRRK